eukprot:11169674-Lingulodinium_polyedra.AAC.1
MEPPQLAESPILAALGGSLVSPEAPLGACLSEHEPQGLRFLPRAPGVGPICRGRGSGRAPHAARPGAAG